MNGRDNARSLIYDLITIDPLTLIILAMGWQRKIDPMQRIRTILKDISSPFTIRAIGVISLVALAFPLYFSNLEFRHTPAGTLKSTFFIYDVPSVAAFLLVKLYYARMGRPSGALNLFLLTWIVSAFLICNSMCSPFLLDIILFGFYNPKSLSGLFSFHSTVKFAESYYFIYKAIALFSVRAAFASYALFALSLMVRPMEKTRVSPAAALTEITSRARHFARHPRFVAYPVFLACILTAIFYPVDQTHSTAARLYAQFRAIDSDGNGVIEQMEFERWMQESFHENTDQADAEFEAIDTNHDGRIDFDEWKRYKSRK